MHITKTENSFQLMSAQKRRVNFIPTIVLGVKIRYCHALLAATLDEHISLIKNVLIVPVKHTSTNYQST